MRLLTVRTVFSKLRVPWDALRNFNGSNGGSSGGKGGGNKFPPLSSSASSSDDGEKKSGNVLAILWAAYISLLDTQPILTKSLTSMTGFALGDILAQKFVEKKVNVDSSGSTSRRRTTYLTSRKIHINLNALVLIHVA